MTRHHQSVGVSLLISLLLSLPIASFATEPVSTRISTPVSTVPSPQAITYRFTQLFEPNHEGEKPRSPLILGKKLDTYTLMLQNNSSHPVQILSGEVINHLKPEEAYAQTKQSAGMQYTENAALGLAMAPLTFGVSLVAGVCLFGPLAALNAGHHNQKALTYINQRPGVIPTDTLQPGQSKSYNLITLKGIKPEIKLSLLDLQTQREWSLP